MDTPLGLQFPDSPWKPFFFFSFTVSFGHSSHQHSESRARKRASNATEKNPQRPTDHEDSAPRKRQTDQRTTAAQHTTPRQKAEDYRQRRGACQLNQGCRSLLTFCSEPLSLLTFCSQPQRLLTFCSKPQSLLTSCSGPEKRDGKEGENLLQPKDPMYLSQFGVVFPVKGVVHPSGWSIDTVAEFKV